MSGQNKFDDLNEKIVAEFQKDGRASNRSVARILGISEAAVRKRLKLLRESGAINYGLVVDVKATPMTSSAWLKVNVRPTHMRAVSQFIGSFENCAFCALVSGAVSVIAFIYGEDRGQLGDFARLIGAREGVIGVDIQETLAYANHRYEWFVPSRGSGAAKWKVK